MPFRVAQLDSLDAVRIAGGVAWRPVRRTLELTAVAANAYTAAEAGGELIEPHDELSPGAGGHEELYVVITGHALFEIDGEMVDAPAGTLLRIDVGTRRQASAREAGTTVLVMGAPPGAAMPPSPFEFWYAAEGPFQAGDFARAYEIAAAGLEHHPDHGALNYQLACYAARGGRHDVAVEHLRVAVENDPRTLEWAKDDEDLGAIRGLPGFPSP